MPRWKPVIPRLWDEAANSAVVVQLNLRDVMVIDLKELKQQPLDVLIKTDRKSVV